MFGRLFYSLGAIAGGAVFSQFPEYYVHYVQRLGGRLDEARLRATQIREDAAAKGLTVKDYIENFLTSPPHSLEGQRMWDSIFHLDKMEATYNALRSAPVLHRPVVFAEHLDVGLLNATFGDFNPAVPLTPEGLVYAGCGALVGLLFCFGSRRLVRRRRRQKEIEA